MIRSLLCCKKIQIISGKWLYCIVVLTGVLSGRDISCIVNKLLELAFMETGLTTASRGFNWSSHTPHPHIDQDQWSTSVELLFDRHAFLGTRCNVRPGVNWTTTKKKFKMWDPGIPAPLLHYPMYHKYNNSNDIWKAVRLWSLHVGGNTLYIANKLQD